MPLLSNAIPKKENLSACSLAEGDGLSENYGLSEYVALAERRV
tara:strand:- start:26223 stop:26351 length:129 start_codon:yes stop_codon:yes gene_type:complete